MNPIFPSPEPCSASRSTESRIAVLKSPKSTGGKVRPIYFRYKDGVSTRLQKDTFAGFGREAPFLAGTFVDSLRLEKADARAVIARCRRIPHNQMPSRRRPTSSGHFPPNYLMLKMPAQRGVIVVKGLTLALQRRFKRINVVRKTGNCKPPSTRQNPPSWQDSKEIDDANFAKLISRGRHGLNKKSRAS